MLNYSVAELRKFIGFFKEWAEKTMTKHPIMVIDDGTTTNEGRLGAVKDMLLAIDEAKVDDDILVAAADNILDFSLKGFVGYFNQKDASVIMCHRETELAKLQRTGVIEVDEDMKVLQMQEKPKVPVSHWAVPPFYIYKKEDIGVLRRCVAEGCNTDAPGNLLQKVCMKTNVYAWEMSGKRHDIDLIQIYFTPF